VRVAILGAQGQLGAALVGEFASGHDVTGFDHAGLDITDSIRVDREMTRLSPAAIVNCAAYNAVDAAEDHPVDALRVNAVALRTLARAARTCRAVLVHYSTDFVFDGRAESPYSEDDRPNPQSVYAASKLLGEWFATDVEQAYVLRVESLFGSAPGRMAKGSLEKIVGALAAGVPARAFEDRTVSLTYAPDAARATRELVERKAPPGLYHCVNSGHATWAEVAYEAARQLGVEPKIERIRFTEARFRAARPRFCALSNRKLAAAGIRMPSWQDALARHLPTLGHDAAHQVADRQA
jgi:dTDP-4-dehydrorhamnose reductase